MKTARLILSLAAATALAVTSYAPDLAVLLGGSDDERSAAADHKEWIEIQSISWPSGGREAAVDPGIAAPTVEGGAAAGSNDAYRPARKTPRPVVLTIQSAKVEGERSGRFEKGRKLGTIRLRDGERVLVLHGVVVADVKRTGDSETISLNYAKIENAKLPERAKAKIKAEQAGKSP